MKREIRFRNAAFEDCGIVFDLSNDLLVRENSVNTEMIDWESHVKWFGEKITDRNCYFRLAFDGEGRFVGQCRVEAVNQEGVISISIAHDFRGKGFSSNIISRVSRDFFRTYRGVKRIKAVIKPSNQRSTKAFEKAGYRYSQGADTSDQRQLIYYLERAWDMETGNVLNFGKVLVVAELSANHNQRYDVAVQTILAAKKAGADAIKLQTYTPDTITIDSQTSYFRINEGTIWDGKTLYSLYKEAYTPWEWQPKLKDFAEKEGLIFFSSPFDKSAVDFLEGINVPAYKVASFEITDIPLIKYIASKGKPVIISTGIATLSDIELAVEACKETGNSEIALLKCTSEYPAPVEDANLRMIPNMLETFGLTVGLSDHTLGHAVPVAAVALGAKIVEKHFILDRKMGGPDARFSMEPEEFKVMVDAIRVVEKALGRVDYSLTEKIKKSRRFARSLFIVKDVRAGELVSEDNVRSIRPGDGLSPRFYPEVVGKKFRGDYVKGTPLNWGLIV